MTPAPIRSASPSRLDRLQLGDLADVEDVAEIAELLGDPQADVGAAGEDARVRVARRAAAASASSVRGASKLRGPRRVRSGRCRRAASAGERARPARRRRAAHRRGQLEHALGRRRRSAGSRCSGTGCRTARRRAAGAVGGACRRPAWCSYSAHSDITKPGVQKPHCEPWQSTIACCTGCSAPSGCAQVFDGEQRLAVERRQELDAGVDRALQAATAAGVARRQFADHDRAGAAVAFGAAFLGAGAARVLAQPVEHGAGRRGVARPRRSRRGGRSGSGGSPWCRDGIHAISHASFASRHRAPLATTRAHRHPRRPARLQRRAGAGARSIPPRCAFAPTTGCSSRAAASSACSAKRRARAGQRHDHARPPGPARLHRHPRAQPADRRHRQLRHRAARLADDAHLPGRGAPRRAGARRERPRRTSSTRCSRTARPRRSSSRPCTPARSTRSSRPPRRAACA